MGDRRELHFAVEDRLLGQSVARSAMLLDTRRLQQPTRDLLLYLDEAVGDLRQA